MPPQQSLLSQHLSAVHSLYLTITPINKGRQKLAQIHPAPFLVHLKPTGVLEEKCTRWQDSSTCCSSWRPCQWHLHPHTMWTGYDIPGIGPWGACPPPEALPRNSDQPCWGRLGMFQTALVLCITFMLLYRGAPWDALDLNLGSPAAF